MGPSELILAGVIRDSTQLQKPTSLPLINPGEALRLKDQLFYLYSPSIESGLQGSCSLGFHPPGALNCFSHLPSQVQVVEYQLRHVQMFHGLSLLLKVTFGMIKCKPAPQDPISGACELAHFTKEACSVMRTQTLWTIGVRFLRPLSSSVCLDLTQSTL